MRSRFNNEIGARVRAQREYMGLTREKLCETVNISPQFLSEIERGTKGASAETLYKLCIGLGISADYVLMGRESGADTTKIAATLATLDPEALKLAEDMLKLFVRAASLSKR